uniref:Uncharacterized protein n=1 Tax=Meloidogyne enterolobii TaxID=390850 RepID=A0A6V7X1A3_MELEN|nr:unnamed protein product [Meloidogyne enterolobii]
MSDPAPDPALIIIVFASFCKDCSFDAESSIFSLICFPIQQYNDQQRHPCLNQKNEFRLIIVSYSLSLKFI